MDTDSFIAYIKTDDIYKDIAEDIETRFDTSNYELNRPLLKGKKNRLSVIGLMTDELGGKVMKEFIGLGANIYSYLIENGSGDKKKQKVRKSES